jgi:hypothetical protein
MPDTRKSKSDLQAQLPDNTVELISPQDLRDFLVTALGGYSSIYVNDGAVAQAGISASPIIVTGFTTIGAEDGFTGDPLTNNRITVDIDCAVKVQFNCSFLGTSNKEFRFHIYKNGAPTGFGFHRKLGTGTDVGAAPAGGTIDCSAGDYIDVRVSSPDGGLSITPVDMQLIVTQEG